MPVNLVNKYTIKSESKLWIHVVSFLAAFCSLYYNATEVFTHSVNLKVEVKLFSFIQCVIDAVVL